MRTFECLGNRIKLITENKDIVNYDFYDKENIYIIEKKEDIEKIPVEFFKTPYKEIDKDILEKYSFRGFVKEIFIVGGVL